MRAEPDIESDVVIVGAGVVGSALALALAKSAPELSITLIDPHGLADLNFHPGQDYDPRVVALNAQSKTFLDQLGVWQGLRSARICPYRAMRVWDGEGTGSIAFHAAEIHSDNLGYIAENKLLAGCLHQAVKECANVACVEASVEQMFNDIRGQKWLLSDGRRLGAPLIVGADGAQSKVRELVGFRKRQWPYAQGALVTTAKFENAHGRTARQWFTDHGPVALLPLAEGGEQFCSIVWSLTEQRLAELAGLEDQAFRSALTRASEQSLGEVLWSDQRHQIPLQQMHVTHYYQAQTVLVGDAAHTIHPLAGQGVNLGLRDVMILVDELARARARGVALTEAATLRRFQRRVQAYNLAAMAVMEVFNRTFLPQRPAVRLLRNWGVGKVDSLLPLKRELMRIAAGDRFNA